MMRGAGEKSRTIVLHLSCFACASVSVTRGCEPRGEFVMHSI